MSKDYNVYKLKSGKTEGAFQLPIRGILIDKEVKIDGQSEMRAKQIQYIKGSDSIFAEDHKGQQKPGKIWFEDGVIMAKKTDWALNEILKKHPWMGKHYILVDEEAEAEKEMQKHISLAEVSKQILDEADQDKIRARALLAFGPAAAAWGPSKCKGQLLQMASLKPEVVLAEMEAPNWQSRYLVAQAMCKGIIKYNDHHTAVVWADGKSGDIVKLAQGENGIEKLGDYIAKGGDQAELLLQGIGERVEAKTAPAVGEASKKAPAVTNPVVPVKSEEEIRAEVEAKFNARINQLETENQKLSEEKEQLSANLTAATSGGDDPENGSGTNTTDGGSTEPFTTDDIEVARAKFLEVKEKEVPTNKKNDLAWIIGEVNKK